MTSSFKRGLKRVAKRHKDIDKLQHVVNLLSAEKKLEAKYMDYQLTGTLKDYRDCHIEQD